MDHKAKTFLEALLVVALMAAADYAGDNVSSLIAGQQDVRHFAGGAVAAGLIAVVAYWRARYQPAPPQEWDGENRRRELRKVAE